MSEPRKSAVIIVHRGDSVLLVHRPNHDRAFPGIWCLPGGSMEDVDKGDPEETAYRELEEETGLTIPDDYTVRALPVIAAESVRSRYMVYPYSVRWQMDEPMEFKLPGSLELDGVALMPVEAALRLPIGSMTRALLVAHMTNKHRYTWPLLASFPLLPDAPGQFAAVRKNDVHTGIDLYCHLHTKVVAMTSGTVVLVEPFTGAHCVNDPSPWWNDTWSILVEGDGVGGVICYGEVTPYVKEGDYVVEGQVIAEVAPVLKKRKGRPTVMLHLELMTRGTRATYWWTLFNPCPEQVLDPTPLLELAHGGVFDQFDMASYDGVKYTDPETPSVQ
jgi:8-oxo-dGTP pyrophosphatase MutT (NUDIX family)